MEKIETKTNFLGAKYNKETKCVEFKLFSKNATKVLLCIFDKPQGEDAILTLEMKRGENDIWETSVKDYILNCHQKPVFYGYRLFGANWEYSENFELGSNIGFVSKVDNKGNRFNPNKIAYDPYSIELSHLPSDINPSLNMFKTSANFHLVDNGKYAIKSIFYPIKEKEIIKVSPRAFSSEVIGEVHIKDLTQNLSMIEKGTYKGAGLFAQSAKKLGITMIEFLPLNEFDSKQNGTNHWGYMPLGYFSLARKYAYDKTYGKIIDEFREMINEFHKNDIKVCLDMVYNHTGEAGVNSHDVEDCSCLSYSLIDNSIYYKVYENGYYRSNSGCGNDFNISQNAVEDLIVNSLAFWAKMGVDAFRFDLAAALLEYCADCDEFYDNINSLAGTIKQRLEDKGIKVVDDFNSAQEGIILIAEPWTCGGNNCYQLGNFPYFWAEWNDVARDIIRKITIRPNEITPAMMKDVIEGTQSRFGEKNKAVNYVASHDGFTLCDLNSYKAKSPQTQGGSDWEICSDYNGLGELKQNAIRKQLALLFLSYGTPMIQIGDIIAHSKNGNNNSYNRDDGINYLNWRVATTPNTFENNIMEYTRNLIKFRLSNPIFSSMYFRQALTYHYDNGEIANINNSGYWNNVFDLFFGFSIDTNNGRIYVASSKSPNKLTFSLPAPHQNKSWHKCLDTSDFHNVDLEEKDYIEKTYILNPHALAIFKES